jgi:hypothetical protein
MEDNADLKRIYDRAGSNDLKLNPKKSQMRMGVMMYRNLSCLLVRIR